MRNGRGIFLDAKHKRHVFLDGNCKNTRNVLCDLLVTPNKQYLFNIYVVSTDIKTNFSLNEINMNKKSCVLCTYCKIARLLANKSNNMDVILYCEANLEGKLEYGQGIRCSANCK